VSSRVRQLFVVAGQLMQKLARLRVPYAGEPVPACRDRLVAARQPVCRNDDANVAGQRSKRRPENGEVPFVVFEGEGVGVAETCLSTLKLNKYFDGY